MQVRVEEVYNPLLMPDFGEEGSEDIMDQPILSLEALGEGLTTGFYRMEEALVEAIDFDAFWDVRDAMEEMDTRCRFRKVGV